MSFNHYHQSVEEILKTASPAQKVLWNSVFLRFGENISISQFCYTGPIPVGNELLVYNANKIYLFYELMLGANLGVVTYNPTVNFFNETNAMSMSLAETSIVFNATTAAINYIGNILTFINMWFSRMFIANGYYSYGHLIGFRIGI